MIALDTNVLVAVHRADHPMHNVALSATKRLITTSTPLAIPWPCAHEFFAIVTHKKIWRDPTPPDRAWQSLQRWQEHNLLFLHESDAHHTILAALISQARITGPQIHDARVAALCIEHRIHTLLTFDRDFSRFAALRTASPATFMAKRGI